MSRTLPLWLLAIALLATFALLCTVVVVRSCGGDESLQASAPTLPPPPPAVAIQIDGFTAFVPPGPERLPDVPENLVDAVRRGTELVSSQRLDKAKCIPEKVVQPGWKRCIGDYLVAAVNEADELQVVEVYGGVSTAPVGFSVACEREDACDGSVNPPFVISAPPGWTAVAVRTVVNGKGPDGVDGVTYVPYSTRLNTPELRQAGLEYLHDAMLAAFYELRAKDVPSQLPGYRVTDFGTVDNAITLTLTEQMLSDVAFEQGTDLERLEMLDRALVTYGLNRAESFAYTLSESGARGALQHMPGSYTSLDALYPAADLPDDHKEGSIDHHTAIKASMLHTDNEWWAFAGEGEDAHRAFLLAHPYERNLVFAAGYNANIKTRVDRVIHECAQRWREKGCGKGCGVKDEECIELPEQSRLYLVKYEWIYGVLFDQAFRAKVEEDVWPTIYERDQAAQADYDLRHPPVAAQATN